MYNRLFGALERIQYQAKSPLFREMTNLCQEVIDALKQQSEIAGLDNADRQMLIAKTMIQLGFGNQLQKIIRTRLNMELRMVYILADPDPNAMMFAEFRPGKDFIMGRGPVSYNRGARKSLSGDWQNFVEDLTKNVDTVDGTLRQRMAKLFTTMMYFTTGMFSFQYQYGNVEALTAEEIAAVLTHEFGHAYTYLEAYCIVAQKTQRLREIIDAIDTKLSGDNLDEFRTILAREIARIADPKTRTEASVILTHLNEKTSFTRDQAMSVYATALSALGFAGAYYDQDVMQTALSASHFERITDEFMSQHGASAAMVSFIEKVYSAVEKGRSIKTLELMKSSRLIKLLVDVHTFWQNAQNLAMVISLSPQYDDLFRRMHLAIQNSTENLKDTNLAPEVRDELIKTIREGRAILAEYENRSYVRMREWYWKTLTRIARPGTTREALRNGNLTADYQRLQEMTKDLVQSPFSYHAARLQSLIERRPS